MEKKTFNVYETPKTEVVEMELQGLICGSVDGPDPGDMEDW